MLAPVTDPFSRHEQLLHPYQCFTTIREQRHLSFNSKTDCWDVCDYEDVLLVAQNHDLFSSDYTLYRTPEADEDDFGRRSMISTDPPRHRQLRSLISQAFTPRALAQLEPRIKEIAHQLLDQVVPQQQMDIITDFSYPLPVIVISEMLGISTSDRGQFNRWSDNLVQGEYEEWNSEEREAVTHRTRRLVKNTIEEMDDYFRYILAQRRQQPQDDLISNLLAARIGEEQLSEEDLLGFCILLLVAGNITTTNLIGNAMLCFHENPGTFERLQAQPALIPSAIEEILRYRSPAVMVGRYARTDIELHGQKIKEGNFVLGWLSCANHDEEQFPEPHRFDIERNPNRHLAFGHGIHFCLGAPLARIETRIALQALSERINSINYQINAIEPVNSAFIYGVKRLPIAFSK